MRKLRLSALAAAAAVALALAGCSSGSLSGETTAPTSAAGGGDLTPVTVGLLQIAPHAAVQLAIDEGIFEKHGLDVTVQLGQGGAALLPAVTSGSIQFAVGNPLSVLVAASQGLEMSMIAGYSHLPEEDPASGLVVRADSGITSYADLEGQTVAVNAVNTQGDLGTMGSVAQDGGDPSKVTFTEIAFPDMLAQLEQGNIDAAWLPEPFLSAALDTEGVAWLGNPLAVIPGLYTTITFTSATYAAENPDIVKAFADGIAEATQFAMDNEDQNREAIVSYTGMPAEVVDNIRLEILSGDLDPTIIEDLSALALEYGFIDSEPDLGTVIAIP
ncbi:ABC transporter substrate-binding protein [Microbacterium sp.]|uniref:ABC transporter substrate-binding protein n=1 Tax=Microbacterium sp. TaxID=51671 RepID=UPI003A896456